MPQSDEAELELRELAAVPHQLISPATTKLLSVFFKIHFLVLIVLHVKMLYLINEMQ
jgi:hypothetical protein